ncbi:MAG: putative quinol monooxygenase [Parvularculaceae bacterium]
MIGFSARLVVRPERAEEFEKLQIELRELTYANEPGTPFYEVVKAAGDEATYMCIATFKDQAAFDFHMQTDFHDRIAPKILDCLAEEMDLTMFDVVGRDA